MIVHRSLRLVGLASVALAGIPALALGAGDPFPKGCVSCHTVDKAKGTDHRISTALAQWTAGKIDADLLAKSKASMPAGVVLKGKHPAAADSLEDIPAACLDCHDPGSKKAPPFSQLLHLVHLVGGTNNAFVTNFKGDCTHCHKLDAKTGLWSMPSGAEQ
jgi:5-methylcytosine-specific restriction endonuclease McrA